MKHKINYLGFLSLLALIAIMGFTTDNDGFSALPIIFDILGLFRMNISGIMFKRPQPSLLCQKWFLLFLLCLSARIFMVLPKQFLSHLV